jgi:hypothetical protein
MLIFGERHLRMVLAEYETHHNGRRPHRSRQLRPPCPDHPVADPSLGRIQRRAVLGGLDYLVVRAPGGEPVGVEDSNPRARRLYQRLGYRAAGRQHASWETEDDTGVLRVYETTLTILRKRL